MQFVFQSCFVVRFSFPLVILCARAWNKHAMAPFGTRTWPPRVRASLRRRTREDNKNQWVHYVNPTTADLTTEQVPQFHKQAERARLQGSRGAGGGACGVASCSTCPTTATVPRAQRAPHCTALAAFCAALAVSLHLRMVVFKMAVSVAHGALTLRLGREPQPGPAAHSRQPSPRPCSTFARCLRAQLTATGAPWPSVVISSEVVLLLSFIHSSLFNCMFSAACCLLLLLLLLPPLLLLYCCSGAAAFVIVIVVCC